MEKRTKNEPKTIVTISSYCIVFGSVFAFIFCQGQNYKCKIKDKQMLRTLCSSYTMLHFQPERKYRQTTTQIRTN